MGSGKNQEQQQIQVYSGMEGVASQVISQKLGAKLGHPAFFCAEIN
jgi:hypothetical protein